MQKHRVLIFPAGSEIGLEIYNALKYSHHIEIYGASGKSDHAAFIYDSDHYIEDEFYIDRLDFVERFNAMLKKLKIEFIFPTHDSVAFYLALHQNDLNAQVLSSCAETNRIARSIANISVVSLLWFLSPSFFTTISRSILSHFHETN